jgi:predicted homoserine dehydrogenase-like protein
VNYEELFRARDGRTVRVGLAGAGEFGRSLLFRSGRARSFEVVAVADRDRSRVEAAARGAGLDPAELTVVDDGVLLADLPLDVVVEATGEPEAAARIAEAAIERGKHVAMVTKEADSVIGPILQARARAKGVIATPVDGDQPSLLVGLVSWCRQLGLEIVCAGKAGEFDFVLDRDGALASPYGTRALQDADLFWRDATSRQADVEDWTRATVPDYCEMAIVANATGLKPDLPELHAPVARTLDLPNLFRPRAAGGLLASEGVVDMFVCLRREDELSFAGGVFVVVRADDRASWELLKGKGIPVSDDLGYALVHNPVHLLGMEAPLSILGAAQLGLPAAPLRPLFDVQARATRDLRAGSWLEIGARHSVPGVDAVIGPAGPVVPRAPVPYYLAAGCRLTADVPAGALISVEAIEPPAASTLWRLRAEQDRLL